MLSKVILNTIFVSIPEELALLAFVLIFIGKKNLICTNMLKYNLKYIIPTVLIPALSSNIIRYVYNAQESIIAIIPPIIMFMMILFIYNKTTYDNIKKKNIAKIFLVFLMVFFIAIVILESICFLLFTQLTNTSMDYINSIILYNFLASLPVRLIQYFILYCLIKKYNSKINILDNMFKNKINMIVNIIMILINIVILAITVKIIVYDKALNVLPLTIQFVIISLFLCSPVLNAITICINIYNILSGNKHE